METDKYIVRFWGARGSYPVPGPHTVRYGGNTTCVELQLGKQTLIIDAGTGIINLGNELLSRSRKNGGQPIVATILLTHMHHDHTQGFPFFPPAYVGTSTLHILGPRTFDQELEQTLNHAVLPPNFPISLHEMPSFKTVRSLSENEMVIISHEDGEPHIYRVYQDPIKPSRNDVCIHIHKSYAHPRNGVYIYRIEWNDKSMVFASDTEGYVDTDRRLVNFARNTDLIVHDAQYTQEEYAASRQGWGHSTPDMACDVARECGAKQLVLCHHEPRYGDDKIAELERKAQERFPNTIAAYEVLELVL